MNNYGKNWDDQQDAQLMALCREGKSLSEMAATMGRTPGAIIARMEHVAIYVKKFRTLREFLAKDWGDVT